MRWQQAEARGKQTAEHERDHPRANVAAASVYTQKHAAPAPYRAATRCERSARIRRRRRSGTVPGPTRAAPRSSAGCVIRPSSTKQQRTLSSNAEGDIWTGRGYLFQRLRARPVNVQVAGPAGFQRSGVLPALEAKDCNSSGCTAYDWIPAIDSSWPVGRYVVSAKADRASANATFEVVAPTGPGIRLLGPSTDWGHNEIAQHTHALLFLTGFPPLRPVTLVAYRVVDYARAASFYSATAVPIPQSGNTVIQVLTGSARPEETFVIAAPLGGTTLFAPVTITKPFVDSSLAVGALPKG